MINESIYQIGVEMSLFERLFKKKEDQLKNSEEEKRKICIKLQELFKDQESAFIENRLPRKTKTLSENGVEEVIKFLKEKKDDVYVLFGSFPLMSQLMPQFRRIPGDIDIQLNAGEEKAKNFAEDLMKRLKIVGEDVRINPKKPAIIDSFKNGKWERAVDIHYYGEPPEDVLSPVAPLWYKGRKEHRLIDAMDYYAIQKTLIESAKKDPSKKEIVEEGEMLLEKWKELWSNEIDFGNMTILNH